MAGRFIIQPNCAGSNGNCRGPQRLPRTTKNAAAPRWQNRRRERRIHARSRCREISDTLAAVALRWSVVIPFDFSRCAEIRRGVSYLGASKR